MTELSVAPDRARVAAADLNRPVSVAPRGLPSTYREVVEAYGVGTFGRSLRLFGPGSPDQAFDLEAATKQTAAELQQYERSGSRFPFRGWPEPGGLVTWGEMPLIGWRLHWVTHQPDSESWRPVATRLDPPGICSPGDQDLGHTVSSLLENVYAQHGLPCDEAPPITFYPAQTA